jgi:hypothetical protein
MESRGRSSSIVGMSISTPLHRRRLVRRGLERRRPVPVAEARAAAEASAGRDGRPVPRWARTAAHLVPAATLPSGLWRIALVLGVVQAPLDHGAATAVDGLGNAAAIVALSVVAEGAALLTLGLIRPWGERVPAWIPLIGGRRIPPYAVIAPAALGALALQAIWTFAFVNVFRLGLGFSSPGWEALLIACYLPLLAWAPLLAATTWAYWRRRCRD